MRSTNEQPREAGPERPDPEGRRNCRVVSRRSWRGAERPVDLEALRLAAAILRGQQMDEEGYR